MNITILTGRLTKDPELKTASSGIKFLKFTIAVKCLSYNQSGNSYEYVDYIDCTAFGREATFISNNFKKDSPINIQGRLHSSKVEKQGVKYYRFEVVVNEVSFVLADKVIPEEPKDEYDNTIGYIDIQSAVDKKNNNNDE